MAESKVRVIAYYLPQFHPIPENDQWWGKGFTEWTNVGKAKPLFKGHYQPRVPADLGYYDLRLPEAREAQAAMAKEYGVEAFCYWHYWFGNGKRLLERPFNEVLASGKPDFPFCLGWANHNWEDKLFNKEGSSKLLIRQEYPGKADHLLHFNTMLPAFKDQRYVRVDDKLLFHVLDPLAMPDAEEFIRNWRQLAIDNSLNGFHFTAVAQSVNEIDAIRKRGFDAVVVSRLFTSIAEEFSIPHRIYSKIMRVGFHRGRLLDYRKMYKHFHGEEDYYDYVYPVVCPNWDHSPRSGRSGHIFINSTPDIFKKHVALALQSVNEKPEQHRVIFLKSWNEWAEGNYIEPDLKFGRGYLEALKEAIDENTRRLNGK
jgi:hypothetical protein